MMTFDPRTESNIATLLPAAQDKAREFMEKCLATGMEVKIISGTRTYEEQDALYEQGRTKPGKIVTKARGGHSWHNFRIAWDIGIFKDGDYLGESNLYAVAGEIGRSIGLEWGGDWDFKDEPHFQLKLGLTLAECRAKKAKGEPIA